MASPSPSGSPRDPVVVVASRPPALPLDIEYSPNSPSNPQRPSLRKRRQRSSSSPELSAAYRRDAEQHSPDGRLSPHDFRLRTSPRPLSPELFANPRPTSELSNSGTGSGSSRNATGEDSLTIRRREANRLAAQRFRNRKKGYQESLEERIRQLEEERDALLRRLGEYGVPFQSSSSGSSYPSVLPNEEDGPTRNWLSSSHSSSHQSNRLSLHTGQYPGDALSPDGRDPGIDVDVRISSLEAANRRLQDELRGAHDEIDRLRDDLDKWRAWEAGRRDRPNRLPEEYPRVRPIIRPCQVGLDLTRQMPRIQPPLGSHENVPQPGPPPQNYHNPNFQPPTLSISHPTPHPPLERASSYTQSSSSYPNAGLRLPPLRLPPLQSAVRHEDPRSANIPPPVLPRPNLPPENYPPARPRTASPKRE